MCEAVGVVCMCEAVGVGCVCEVVSVVCVRLFVFQKCGIHLSFRCFREHFPAARSRLSLNPLLFFWYVVSARVCGFFLILLFCFLPRIARNLMEVFLIEVR